MRHGVYCGEKWYSIRSWMRYGLFHKFETGFGIGPIVFWKENNATH